MLNQKIIEFLVARGWIGKSENDRFKILKPPTEIGLPDDFEMAIPKSVDHSDIDKFLQNIIETVSDIYLLSVDDLNIILNEQDTLLKVRIYDTFAEEGKLPLVKFEIFIDKIKSILRDTASFVINNDAKSNIIPPEANKYIEKCNFLQTGYGSFVTNIQLPSTELIKEKEVFEDKQIYSEDINERLFQVLSFVNNEIFNKEESNLNEAYLLDNRKVVNVKLLKDIEDFYQKTDIQNIDFSFNSAVGSGVIKTENITKVKLNRLTEFIDYIGSIGFEIVELTFRGQINTLKSKDPEGGKNAITIGGIYDGMPYHSMAHLDSEQYKQAIEAHKLKQYVNITGIAKKSKTRINFTDVVNLTVDE